MTRAVLTCEKVRMWWDVLPTEGATRANVPVYMNSENDSLSNACQNVGNVQMGR